MRSGVRRFGLAAVLALGGLATAAVDESFLHTDDGCPVEIHCVACRWAAASTVLPALAVAPAPIVLEDVGVLCRSHQPRLAPVVADATSIRGPPSL